ncbi:MAG TPA: hypothetical protein VGD67_25450, partial [Pseudonocardiaceae bacterium]
AALGPRRHIMAARQLAAGWVVHADGARPGDEAVLHVDVSGAARPLVTGDGMVMAVDEAGERVAVRTASGVVVVTVTGTVVGERPRPARGVELAGWAGDVVLFADPEGDHAGLMTWDPVTGREERTAGGWYVPVGNVATRPADDRADLLAFRLRPDGGEACLVELDPADGLAERRSVCGIDPRLVVGAAPARGEALVVLDRRTTPPRPLAADTERALRDGTVTWTPLGLPEGVRARSLWWEDGGTLLMDVRTATDPARELRLVRCPVDGTPCERVPSPRVDGGPAEGLGWW